jgi:hypothetical protein
MKLAEWCAGGLVMTAATLLVACGGGSSASMQPTFPSVQGTWRGTWGAQNCTATGTVPPGTCANQSGAFGFSLTQSGSAVTGTLQTCGGRVAVTGIITQDGVIALQTQAPIGTPPTTIGSWAVAVAGTTMGGVLTCSVQMGATSQDAIAMVATLDNVTRVSTEPNAGF